VARHKLLLLLWPAAGCFMRLGLHLLMLRLSSLPAYVLRSVRRSG
jgi:hypothetical protein